MKNYLKNNKKFRLKFLFSDALPLQLNGDGQTTDDKKKMKINTLGIEKFPSNSNFFVVSLLCEEKPPSAYAAVFS